MLTSLSITNYALISSLEFEPSAQFNTITGETGAGKSIMLGALGLLLGNRADTKILLDPDKKCIVEGHFDISRLSINSFFEDNELDFEEVTIVRREITASGKSRGFINDSPVTLDLMKELGSHLIDIHSQHENLILGKRKYKLNILDSLAGNTSLLKTYQQAFREFRNSNKNFLEVSENAERIKAEYEFNKFQLDELNAANLVEGEDEELKSGLKIQENAEQIASEIQRVISLIQNDSGAASILGEAKQYLNRISSFSSNLEKISERLNTLVYELDDLESELQSEAAKVDLDPQKLQENRERLDTLYSLQVKHRVNSVGELIEVQDNLSKSVSTAENLDGELEQLKAEMEKQEKEMSQLAGQLSENRKSISRNLENDVLALLSELGMPKASLKIELNSTDFDLLGSDQVDFLFSANAGTPPQPIHKVASGGEFSRLMFAIKKILATHTSLPTMIFDEIDTGVSGEIAIKTAGLMKEMARNHQLITITHLPQIAAKGDDQFFVYKEADTDTTISNIRKLSEEERIEEIAQMIGGNQPTESAIESAKELLSV